MPSLELGLGLRPSLIWGIWNQTGGRGGIYIALAPSCVALRCFF